MIDRALGLNATESYYFQLYPVNLILLREPVPSPESKFNFSIYKGIQYLNLRPAKVRREQSHEIIKLY